MFIFFLGAISLGSVVVPSPRISINLPTEPNIVKENQIGSVVSEILWYTQIDILLLSYNELKIDVFLKIWGSVRTEAH